MVFLWQDIKEQSLMLNDLRLVGANMPDNDVRRRPKHMSVSGRLGLRAHREGCLTRSPVDHV